MIRRLLAGAAVMATVITAAPSPAAETPMPALFGVADGLPTALTVGPDGRIYATVVAPDFGAGWVLAWADAGRVGGPPERVADGLRLPMGIAFGPDGTLYVSENASLDGPGTRGNVSALTDPDGDGTYDTHEIVIGNIPNGRHQTNGLTFAPDGKLYVANGSATDDGVECGPFPSTTCVNQEVQPWTGSILRVDPAWRDVDLLAGDVPTADVLVAEGMRNIYSVAFRPEDPTSLYTVMNGPDDPSGSEPIYRTETADTVIDDMGFPSCLYDPHDNRFPEPQIGGHEHPGDFSPRRNPNPAVIAQFGPCEPDAVVRPLGFASAHAGSGGLDFVPAGPNAGDLVYAEWGSIWNLNGAQPTGHKVFRHEVNDDGTLGVRYELATLPLPIDVTFDAAGVLYVADQTGGIYRIAASWA